MRDEALQKIKAAKLRRLEEIELRIAEQGEYDADLKLTIERDEIRQSLGMVDAVVGGGGIDEETRRILRRYDQADLNIAVLSNLVTRVTTIEEWLTFERGTRVGRQRLTNGWMAVITLLLVFLLARSF